MVGETPPRDRQIVITESGMYELPMTTSVEVGDCIETSNPKKIEVITDVLRFEARIREENHLKVLCRLMGQSMDSIKRPDAIVFRRQVVFEDQRKQNEKAGTN